MGIQINGNTNNINAGIGSLSIEDINELDIVGVATASNFKTGVSNLHSVGLTLSGGQLDVGSNIKLGNAGVVTATSYRGDGSQLTGITGTTINNNAANRLITGSGTANTLNGNTYATWNGSNLALRGGEGADCSIELASDEGDDNPDFWRVMAQASDNALAIDHYGSGSWAERLRIDSSGRIIKGHTGTYAVAGHYPSVQLTGTTFNDATLSLINNVNDSTGSYILLSKQRSGSPAGATIVQNDDLVGQIMFTAGDGTDVTSRIAEIKGMVDGTPGSNDTPGRLSFWTTADGAQSSTERLLIASDGNVHINTVDNGNASAKLNVEDSSSVGVDVLKIMNKPSGANGKAKLVFHTETSAGQGCSPYIQSLSGADAGPNASNNHNAGGLEFHTRSGGAGTDNNAMRIRDDGTVEKYGSVGQILLKPSGAELEFTRGSASNILCSHSAGYLNIFTGGYTNVPAMRIFASAGAGTGAKVGINTDQSGGDWQMAIHANPSVPSMMISHGIRMLTNTNNDKRINFSGVNYTAGSFQANNNWNRIAMGRYMGGSFTLVIGDASSKNTIFGNFHLTAPNYGVAHLNKIATNGNWNTGSSDIQVQSDGLTYDYAIMARHNSYYNSSATASYGLITNLGL